MKRYRIPVLLLCLALLLPTALAAGPSATLSPPSLADSSYEGDANGEARSAAEALYSLGLFQGIIAGRFDDESMALDRAASRSEAMVMFVRLLGREYEARNGGYTHPFNDVAAWAGPYVGYAYQSGLTKGAGGGRFGSSDAITLGAYATFLLRALNYEEGVDFTWQSAADKGLELGLYQENMVEHCKDGMTRGDLALVSRAALSQEMRGSDKTLVGHLADLGLVDERAALDLGLSLNTAYPSGTPAPEPEVTPAEPGDRSADIQAVADLVNEARAAEGLGPLTLDDGLTACAMVRAEEIGWLFEHTRPDGTECFTILSEMGYGYSYAGENIAAGYRTPKSVVNAWLNSPGHRANILGASYGRIGVGVVNNQWVQLFSD